MTDPLPPRAADAVVPEVPAEVARAISQVAADRGDTWRIIDRVLARPDVDLVRVIRDGSLLEDLRRSIHWLDEDSVRFLEADATLGVLARRSARIPEQSDLDELGEDFALLFTPGQDGSRAELDAGRSAIREAARRMTELCEAESSAWGSGDVQAGKDLRAEQAQLLESELVPGTPGWAHALHADARRPFYRMIARLIVSALSVETGRDFDRTVFAAGPRAGQ